MDVGFTGFFGWSLEYCMGLEDEWMDGLDDGLVAEKWQGRKEGRKESVYDYVQSGGSFFVYIYYSRFHKQTHPSIHPLQ